MSSGVPAELAPDYVRLTAKGTRAQWFLDLFRAAGSLTKYTLSLLWRGWESLQAACGGCARVLGEWCANLPKPMLVHVLSLYQPMSKSVASALGVPGGVPEMFFAKVADAGWFRNEMARTTSWCQQHPTVSAFIEDALLFIETAVWAAMEEVGKNLVGRWFPALGKLYALFFGIVEAVETLVTEWRKEASWDMKFLAYHIGKLLFHASAHLFLFMCPLWFSIPVHTLFNFIQFRRAGFSSWVGGGWRHVGEYLNQLQNPVEPPVVPLTVPDNFVALSKVYGKDADGNFHFIASDLSARELLSEPVASAKPIVVDCEASRLIVKPSGTLLDIVTLEVARLQKPIPFDPSESRWDSSMVLLEHVFFGPLYDAKGVLDFLDPAGLRAYVHARPWTASRKKETIDMVDEWEAGAKLNGLKELMPKRDEVLPHNPALGSVACKTRPLLPRAAADVPAIGIAVPLKHYLGGTHWWHHTDSGLAYGKGPGENFSITYLHDPRADSVTSWFNEVLPVWGFHAVIHGDDMYGLWVDINGVPRACAVDLESCDKSCRDRFQRAFCYMCNLFSAGRHASDVKRQYDRLSGEQRLKGCVLPSFGQLFLMKEGVSTATGEPLTSVKACFGHFVGLITAFASCQNTALFPFSLRTVYRELGLVPEFESNTQLEMFFHPSAVTFLGGMFCETATDWKWVANKQIKAYFLFPDIESIYRGEHKLEQHMSVLLRDSELCATPVGRSLAGWFTRCLSGVADSGLWDRAALSFERHLLQNDRYKAEKWTQGRYSAPVVKDLDYFEAARHMLERLGRGTDLDDLRMVVYEIKHAPAQYPLVLTTSGLGLYALRFGLPKQKVEVSPPVLSLSVGPTLLFLGQKIFSLINFDHMSERNAKTSKKPTKATATVNKKNVKASVPQAAAPKKAAPKPKAKVIVRMAKQKGGAPGTGAIYNQGSNVLDAAGSHMEHGQQRQGPMDVGWSKRKGGLQYQLTHSEQANLEYLHALHNPEDFDAQVGIPATLGTPQGKSVLVHYQLSGSFQTGQTGLAFCTFHPPLNFGFDIAANGTTDQGGTPTVAQAPSYIAGQAVNKVPHTNYANPGHSVVMPQPAVLTFSNYKYATNEAPNPGVEIDAAAGVEAALLPVPDINLNDFSSACLVSAVLKVAPIESALNAQGRIMIGRGATLLHSVPNSFGNTPSYTGVFADQSNEIRTASVPNWDPKTMMRCTYTPRAEGVFTPTGCFGSDFAINGAGQVQNYPAQIVGYPGMMCLAEAEPSGNTATGGTFFAYEAYLTYELWACGTSFASEQTRATEAARPYARPMPPMVMRASDVPKSAGNLAISQMAEDKPPGFIDAVKKGLVEIPGQIKFGVEAANAVAEGVETAWDVIEDIGLALGGIFGLAHAEPPRILHPLVPRIPQTLSALDLPVRFGRKGQVEMTIRERLQQLSKGKAEETDSELVQGLTRRVHTPMIAHENPSAMEEEEELLRRLLCIMKARDSQVNLDVDVEFHTVPVPSGSPATHRGPRKTCPLCNPPPLPPTPQ